MPGGIILIKIIKIIKMNYKGNDYKQVYTKAIAISVDDMKYVETTRGKKSRAGKLAEIIKHYKSSSK